MLRKSYYTLQDRSRSPRIDRLSVCLGWQRIPIATSEYISTWFRAYCPCHEFGVKSAFVSVPTLHYLLAHCCPYTCALVSPFALPPTRSPPLFLTVDPFNPSIALSLPNSLTPYNLSLSLSLSLCGSLPLLDTHLGYVQSRGMLACILYRERKRERERERVCLIF